MQARIWVYSYIVHRVVLVAKQTNILLVLRLFENADGMKLPQIMLVAMLGLDVI